MFSLRKSIVVWVSGAILGWVFAVVSVYNMLRFDGDNIAENESGTGAPAVERSLAAEDPTDGLTPQELEAIVETAPAAGDDQGDTDNDNDSDSDSEETDEDKDTDKPER